MMFILCAVLTLGSISKTALIASIVVLSIGRKPYPKPTALRRRRYLPFASLVRNRDTPEMEPKFSEMNKVRVTDGQSDPYEGFVIASQFRDGRWIYKLSISEDPRTSETYDNWVPEEWLQRAK
jgi:hypothetical protein